jgi:hypothetical protein
MHLYHGNRLGKVTLVRFGGWTANRGSGIAREYMIRIAGGNLSNSAGKPDALHTLRAFRLRLVYL